MSELPVDPWLLLFRWPPKCFAINLLYLVNSDISQIESISTDDFVLQAVMVKLRAIEILQKKICEEIFTTFVTASPTMECMISEYVMEFSKTAIDASSTLSCEK